MAISFTELTKTPLESLETLFQLAALSNLSYDNTLLAIEAITVLESHFDTTIELLNLHQTALLFEELMWLNGELPTGWERG